MPANAAATVLIPTYTHGETLRYSVPTALRQSVSDIEVFIVGDGVPDVTRVIAGEFVAADSRVRFFDLPKGPSRGELHRHLVLGKARGEIVCYLFDDDLWIPGHVEVMRDLLRDADLVFTRPVVVGPGGELSAPFVDLASPLHRRLFTDSWSATASVPTCAAHTMALYRRLPYGWRTTLADMRRTNTCGHNAWRTGTAFPGARHDPLRSSFPIRRVGIGQLLNASRNFNSGATASTIGRGVDSSISRSRSSAKYQTGACTLRATSSSRSEGVWSNGIANRSDDATSRRCTRASDAAHLRQGTVGSLPLHF